MIDERQKDDRLQIYGAGRSIENALPQSVILRQAWRHHNPLNPASLNPDRIAVFLLTSKHYP